MNFLIDNKNSGKRLDVFLAENIKDYTRSYIKKLIEEGKITVNSNIVKAGNLLKCSDNVEVEEIEPKIVDIKPKKIDLDIVYEDDDIIIINKSKGMVVHPGNGNYEDTIVN